MWRYGVGVVIRSKTWRSSETERFHSTYDSIVYDHVETSLSESQAEAEELNKSQSVGTCIVIGLSFRLSFQLPQYGSH